MIPVLVAAELEPFFREAGAPADVAVELLAPDREVPAGPYRGILPLLTRRIGPAEMDRLPELRVIANFAVGYDNVDLDAARARGIRVSNTPDVLTEATAELTWALILSVARRTGEGERVVRSGSWTGWEPTQLLGTGLSGRILGIAGAGRIGREVGRRAGVFGMRVAYWTRSPRVEWELRTGAERVMSLEALAERADVLSVHLASTDQTRGLINGVLLDRMKDGAIVVNTSRGDVIDESALIERLESGRLRAGLDVYAGEPTVPDRLLRLDNVVLLPHLGSATRSARRGMWDRAWTNLLLGVRDSPLENPVV